MKNLCILQENNFKDRDMHCDKYDIMIYFMYSETGINFYWKKIFSVLGLVYMTLSQKTKPKYNQYSAFYV